MRNWEKIVAREWLYLLSFACFALFVIAVFFLTKPRSIPHPEQRPSNYVDADSHIDNEIEESLLDWLRYYKLKGTAYADSTKDNRAISLFWHSKLPLEIDSSLIESKDRSSSNNESLSRKQGITNELDRRVCGAPVRLRFAILFRFYGFRDSLWVEDNKRYDQYLFRSALHESLGIIFLLVPYPLFLLIRSIRWSVKQMRESQNNQ